MQCPRKINQLLQHMIESHSKRVFLKLGSGRFASHGFLKSLHLFFFKASSLKKTLRSKLKTMNAGEVVFPGRQHSGTSLPCEKGVNDQRATQKRDPGLLHYSHLTITLSSLLRTSKCLQRELKLHSAPRDRHISATFATK